MENRKLVLVMQHKKENVKKSMSNYISNFYYFSFLRRYYCYTIMLQVNNIVIHNF